MIPLPYDLVTNKAAAIANYPPAYVVVRYIMHNILSIYKLQITNT